MTKNSDHKNKILKRGQILKEFRWDIESLYKNDQEWEQDCHQVEQLINQLLTYQKSFTQEANSFLNVLKLKDSISELLQKIYTYAHMRKDEDNNNSHYQSIFYQACCLLVKAEEALSFIESGILALDFEKLKGWLKEVKQLQVYQHYLEKVYRKKEHILSPVEEQIIARSGEMAMVFEDSFQLLSYADLTFPRVKDENGQIIPITQSNFISLLKSGDRDFRKNIFKKYYRVYQQHRNIYASLLAGSIKKDGFYSKSRRYQNSLEAALFEDNISVDVYNNLIDIVHKNIHLLHDYMQLKGDFLHLDYLHMYDIYAPLSEDTLRIDYHEAQTIILDSLLPLGEFYLSVVKEGFRERWIDVYENKGKTSGAYSTGSYGSKPFILMNYQSTLEDVYTLTHELGHSLHSYFTNKTQPFIYSDISIFLAEIASTTNEVLLTYHLLNQVSNKTDQITILHHFLEQFRTTFFRQAMFAEFELMIHRKQEGGESLTTDSLAQQYADLNSFYYGKNVIIDQEITLEWARIPHFYYHFYVYQYATGFAAAITLARTIMQEGPAAARRYIDFLSKGSADYPVSILKRAGVDVTATDYLADALQLFSELLGQLRSSAEDQVR
jgi:oligoendopeptidase F